METDSLGSNNPHGVETVLPQADTLILTTVQALTLLLPTLPQAAILTSAAVQVLPVLSPIAVLALAAVQAILVGVVAVAEVAIAGSKEAFVRRLLC